MLLAYTFMAVVHRHACQLQVVDVMLDVMHATYRFLMSTLPPCSLGGIVRAASDATRVKSGWSADSLPSRAPLGSGTHAANSVTHTAHGHHSWVCHAHRCVHKPRQIYNWNVRICESGSKLKDEVTKKGVFVASKQTTFCPNQSK